MCLSLHRSVESETLARSFAWRLLGRCSHSILRLLFPGIRKGGKIFRGQSHENSMFKNDVRISLRLPSAPQMR